MESLTRWNIVLSALHGLTAFTVAFIFSVNNNSRLIDTYRGSIPQDLIHPVIDCNGEGNVQCPDKYSKGPIDRCKTINFPYITKKTGTYDPALLLIIFFLITSIAHLLYALDFAGFYSHAILKEGWNPYRWFEYGLSASIMAFLISLIDGERNLNAATLLAVMTGVTQIQGLIVENNFRLTNIVSNVSYPIFLNNIKFATLSGWLLFVGVWYVLAKNFVGILNDANAITLEPQDQKIKIPIWVYIVVFTQMFNFALFGFVQRSQIKNASNNLKIPYTSYEKRYMGLSFSSKFILGFFVTFGIIQRTSRDNC